jgi:dihydrofolate reductase
MKDDMSRKVFLQNLWRWKCGLPEVEQQRRLPPPSILMETEWSQEFEERMRNRLIMGALRYGCMKAKGKPSYDRMSSIIKRANKYKETGNQEHLVDIANLCMLEYEEPSIAAHWAPSDDGEHVRAT